MTTWSRQDVAGFLAAAGMPANRINEFVAIAVCESSLDDQAVSPADAIGLWQVIPSTAAGVGFTRAQMFNPRLNAIAAVRISGHGA
ncbi:MAG TPA: transglycosylase SLT domain-containing protein, partial [Streptosporangiaceae bacterium]|nr:transglycosylase SLT domain-containing protein [Streptosporangiaceae bacterium]